VKDFHHVGYKGKILVITNSGYTAKMISKARAFRPRSSFPIAVELTYLIDSTGRRCPSSLCRQSSERCGS
jgi:hypothetical protein